ncbi:MAG: twin-arginine translocation signal domain-containing protein [Verrucomicrobia bacterium]|nr:twin-arginine translocation signal domain-containing protein [Verrucomicrobiota bacterium]
MKTTRRKFLEAVTGIGGSLTLGTTGWGWTAVGGDTPPTRLISYRGLRPTDPAGDSGCAIRSGAGGSRP